MFKKVSFSEELPPEKSEVFFSDHKGKKFSGYYSKGYVTIASVSELHPISWYSYWLKEIH